jgi:hypothetical protein
MSDHPSRAASETAGSQAVRRQLPRPEPAFLALRMPPHIVGLFDLRHVHPANEAPALLAAFDAAGAFRKEVDVDAELTGGGVEDGEDVVTGHCLESKGGPRNSIAMFRSPRLSAM